MEPSLAFLFPDGASRVLPLAGGNGRSEFTVGREADNTVEIDHPAVSRRHLRLLRSEEGDGGWRAEDLRSANGTLRNGDPLGIGEPVELRDGDCLAFGPDPAAVRAVYLHPHPLGDGPEPDDFPPPGTTLAGRYELREALGQTADFQNYRATDAGNDQAATSLKVYRPEALPEEAFPALVARVDRLRAIPSHPGVVRCLDARREANRAFVAARWVDGAFPTLDLLRARGALTPTEALRLLTAAAAASDHAAEHGQAALDLSLRPTLVSFHPPLADAVVWESLRAEPLERWPAFTLRFAVALLAPSPETGERLSALARFACELLGRPLPEGRRVRPPRIVHPALGETGNEVLRQALTGEARGETTAVTYASGREFVTALAQAAGLG